MDYTQLDEQNKPLDESPRSREKNCVICLDFLDDTGVVAKQKSDIARAPECNCNYLAHKSCFEQWVQDKPTEDLSCLVCGSEMELIVSRREQCQGCMKKHIPQKNIGFLATIAAVFFVYLLMNTPR